MNGATKGMRMWAGVGDTVPASIVADTLNININPSVRHAARTN